MKSSKNDIEKIFSWKSILSYLKSERKGKEAHDIEKEASSDPFLSDAIEGYKEFGDETEDAKNLREIENYIAYRKSQEKGSNRSGNRILAIAASFAVLISASLWVWFSLFNQVQNDSVVEIPQTTQEEQREEMPKEAEVESTFSETEQESVEEALNEQVTSKDSDLEEKKSVQEKPNIPAQAEESLLAHPKSSAAPGTLTYESKTSMVNNESEIDNLISRILNMEKEFWELQNVNSLALNDIPSALMDEQEADLVSDSSEPMQKETRRKKVKANRSMAAGAESVELKSVKQDRQTDSIMKPEVMIDSLILGKRIEIIDSVAGNTENHLLLGINKFYQKDTSEAIKQLKMANPRSASQKVLIDSLLQQLNP